MTEFILRHELWIAVALLILAAGAAACIAQTNCFESYGGIDDSDLRDYDNRCRGEYASIGIIETQSGAADGHTARKYFQSAFEFAEVRKHLRHELRHVAVGRNRNA